jgi:hypothetical protein
LASLGITHERKANGRLLCGHVLLRLSNFPIRRASLDQAKPLM